MADGSVFEKRMSQAVAMVGRWVAHKAPAIKASEQARPMAQTKTIPPKAKAAPLPKLPTPEASATRDSLKPWARARSFTANDSAMSEEPAIKVKFHPSPNKKSAAPK